MKCRNRQKAISVLNEKDQLADLGVAIIDDCFSWGVCDCEECLVTGPLEEASSGDEWHFRIKVDF